MKEKREEKIMKERKKERQKGIKEGISEKYREIIHLDFFKKDENKTESGQ